MIQLETQLPEKLKAAKPLEEIDLSKQCRLRWFVEDTGIDHESNFYLPGKDAVAHLQKTRRTYEQEKKRFGYLVTIYYLEDTEGNTFQ